MDKYNCGNQYSTFILIIYIIYIFNISLVVYTWRGESNLEKLDFYQKKNSDKNR